MIRDRCVECELKETENQTKRETLIQFRYQLSRAYKLIKKLKNENKELREKNQKLKILYEKQHKLASSLKKGPKSTPINLPKSKTVNEKHSAAKNNPKPGSTPPEYWSIPDFPESP